jgi:serine protease AprX
MTHAARIRWAEALRIRWAEALRIRWGMQAMSAVVSALLLTLTVLVAIQLPTRLAQAEPPAAGGGASLDQLAAAQPAKRVDVIVQLGHGTSVAEGSALVRAAGGQVTRNLHIINGVGARLGAAAAANLADKPGVRFVSLNGAVKPSSIDTSMLATAYTGSINADDVWNAQGNNARGQGVTGAGVGVAVVDTGIQGDLPDFRVSQSDSHSRVVADAVVNPDAKSAGDGYGHGTHVAGLIAGNGLNRSYNDPLYGKYVGVAPAADLINVKASDDEGNATTLDVIDGLQFVVDHKDEFNIRVVNLSLNEATPSSYRTNPLDAAVEQAWNAGIVVVAAAGNRGNAPDAVQYAPGNDPFVITVGAVDDKGTATSSDDGAASWSSTGTTKDGHAKPDFLAPGAHMVSTLAKKSDITDMCPSCVVSSSYFRMGGTSMATAVTSGAVALLLDSHRRWTPNQVKSAVRNTLREVPGGGQELDVQAANDAKKKELKDPNQFEPNRYLDPATGAIDYSRSSWSRSSWSRSSWSRSSWSRSSWSCTTCIDDGSEVDPSRSSWSRSSWSRSSWSASFTK